MPPDSGHASQWIRLCPPVERGDVVLGGKYLIFNDNVNDYTCSVFTVTSAVFRTTCSVDYTVSREDLSVSKLSAVRDSVQGFSVHPANQFSDGRSYVVSR